MVVCAGAQGRVVADILRRAHEAGEPASAIGFVDDTPEFRGATIGGLPVLGPIAALPSIEHDAIVVAYGENDVRRTLTERLVAAGERLATAIHPMACIGAGVEIGEGVVICAGAIVAVGAKLGRGVVLNTKASVDHDSILGDFAHVSAGGTIGARVRIGAETLIALGASVVSRTTVGARTTIGAGAVVINDIPDDVIAYGVPARQVRSRT